MPKLLSILSTLCAVASTVVAQPTPPADHPLTPPAPTTLESIAPAQRALVRQRAMHVYKMPDGAYWDGTSYFELRRVLDHTLKAYDQIEHGRGAPGQTIVEDRVVGTGWKVKSTRESKAWGLIGYLAGEDGEVEPRRFEAADRLSWRDAPPLWSCAESEDYSWPFAYVDESEPDEYTRQTHGGYLEITRDWGDGRFDFKGYSLDRGRVEGVVRIAEPRRFIRKDRFKGAFFLWPTFNDEAGGKSRSNWDLVPADEARVTADQLAGALLSGRAQIVDWRFETVKDKVIWKRILRTIEPAPDRPIAEPTPKPPPPTIPQGGPDLVVLNDGRYFRGRITRRDDTAVVIRVWIGQMETDMTFKPDEVKEVQAPEKR